MKNNMEIIEENLDLLKTCIDYQFAKIPQEYKDDFMQDLIIELAEYPKLESTYNDGHLNALITKIIKNNIYSKTSWYYRRYIRPERTEEITEKERQIPDA